MEDDEIADDETAGKVPIRLPLTTFPTEVLFKVKKCVRRQRTLTLAKHAVCTGRVDKVPNCNHPRAAGWLFPVSIEGRNIDLAVLSFLVSVFSISVFEARCIS